ncbi:DUF7710 domain-containing protein [Deinococcus betulae]|uniref:DUF7710 domain-containing protein n=1 Tax=Deinococcus betulae TaxID=2873312 RepID=UPI003F6FBE02
MGARAKQPAAVFSTLELGEAWAQQHGLEGMLTWYPLDMSVYEWVVAQGRFSSWPETPTPQFLAGFSSASQPHHHYERPEESGG